MKNHSMIFDDFFADPRRAKALIGMQDVADIKYDDGVVYPNIALLPPSVEEEIVENLSSVIGGDRFQLKLAFARYSFEHTEPPHWAHSDGNIAQFLGLIYLNDGPDAHKFGTCTLKHKDFGFEMHPETEMQKQILLAHANKREEWEVTYECPAKFNRLMILNANLIHAAMGQYGTNRDDGRVVISVFFNLVGMQ